MNKKEELMFILGLGMGILIGAVLGAVIIKISPSSYTIKAYKQYEKGIELVAQCEKELPRNQYCEAFISVKVKEVQSD